jgi:alpha-1,2-mannosyltransferase
MNAEASLAPAARRQLILVAVICGLYGLCAIAIYTIHFGQLPWQDWMVYYTAARAYLGGNLPLIFDGTRLTAQMNTDFAAWLPKPLSFHPWLYPPSYLLVLIPFGLLPFAVACIVFLITTFACLVAAVWRAVGGGYRRWLHLFSLVLAPAVAFNVGTGQNAFLTTALLVGGFGLLPRRPLVAGVLLGLITYKPQLWLLVPVALVAGRQWPALAITIVTAGLMVLASVAVLGIEPWRVWIDWFLNAPPETYQTWLTWGRLHGESVYTNLVLIGASHAAATAGQWITAIAAAACVWWCYRRRLAGDLQLAVLLAATVLAAPHVTNYDTVLLVIAATLVFAHGLDHGFSRGELIVPLLVWMIQLFNPPDVFRLGRITPVLTAFLIASAIASARASAVAIPATAVRPGLPDAVPSPGCMIH